LAAQINRSQEIYHTENRGIYDELTVDDDGKTMQMERRVDVIFSVVAHLHVRSVRSASS
jgi:hypothetical protein